MGELARRKAATEREIRYKTLSVSPFGLPPLPKGEALVQCKLTGKSEFEMQLRYRVGMGSDDNYSTVLALAGGK